MLILTVLIPCIVMPVIDGIFIYFYRGKSKGCRRCRKRMDPDPEWTQKYQNQFDQLGVANFSISVAHVLHGLTIEAAMTSFNIKLPIQNGIPGINPDLSANDSDALLSHLPSRPNGYSSPGLHGFVDYMDHINDPDWMQRGNKLERMLHSFHMQEMWAVARKAADSFSGVSDDICVGALDHAHNGIDEDITVIFQYFKYTFGEAGTVPEKNLTWNDNGESWKLWKAALPSHQLSSGSVKSMGLYTHCLMRKFRQTERQPESQTEQPIEVDGCCDSKTVGEYSYTKVSTGEVPPKCLNNCIYSRDDKPGSKYCFAIGEEKVHCLE